MRLLCILLYFFPVFFASGQAAFVTPFELHTNQTTTYEDCIRFYQDLAGKYDWLKIYEAGFTDAGLPLHLVVLSKDGLFSPSEIRAKGRSVLFVNNGIHPGEPEGIDASMMWIRDLLNRKERQDLLEKVAVVLVPVYNVGGALNRNSFSRANQNGPESYGFRGNAKNLDLNRDFIKCDSKNAGSLVRQFAFWSPDVFIDNHTSNGADYKYTITLIESQRNKMETPLADFMTNKLTPGLYREMKRRNWEMCPYVDAPSTPDEGIVGFLDLPRYSTGFSTLHQSIGYTVETHMLKPFEDRVWATYHFMDALLRQMADNRAELQASRQQAFMMARHKQTFELTWKLDTTVCDSFLFKGYEPRFETSEVSGLTRLRYDRLAPFEKMIPWWNTYKGVKKVSKPIAYIIPQAYEEVVDRLKWNGVVVKQLKNDINLEVEKYRIESYQTTKSPYEGHYLHYDVEVSRHSGTALFRQGDYVVFLDQPLNRLIVETLEPEAPDGYFAWNFFDGVLMQKEYFSSYVFEDVAASILASDPALAKSLRERRERDPDFARSARQQLDFIYKNSPYYEKTHLMYPVARLEKFAEMPLD